MNSRRADVSFGMAEDVPKTSKKIRSNILQFLNCTQPVTIWNSVLCWGVSETGGARTAPHESPGSGSREGAQCGLTSSCPSERSGTRRLPSERQVRVIRSNWTWARTIWARTKSGPLCSAQPGSALRVLNNSLKRSLATGWQNGACELRRQAACARTEADAETAAP